MEDKSIKTATGYEIRENSGNLFKNDSDNPKAPSYKGLVNIEGVGYQLALWKTEKGYLNVKFTKHEISDGGKRESYHYENSEKLTPPQVKKTIEKLEDEFNDDIPF